MASSIDEAFLRGFVLRERGRKQPTTTWDPAAAFSHAVPYRAERIASKDTNANSIYKVLGAQVQARTRFKKPGRWAAGRVFVAVAEHCDDDCKSELDGFLLEKRLLLAGRDADFRVKRETPTTVLWRCNRRCRESGTDACKMRILFEYENALSLINPKPQPATYMHMTCAPGVMSCQKKCTKLVPSGVQRVSGRRVSSG